MDNGSNDLVIGKSYTGVIKTVSANGLYSIQVDEPSQLVSGAYLIIPALGGLLGFVVRSRLTPKTRVAFIYDSQPAIIGVIPTGDSDINTSDSRSAANGPVVRTARDLSSNPMPRDMLDGEFEIGNMHGVVLQFLTTILKIGAGDLAKIEFSLVENLLRVVSEQFRHVSALGDEVMYDFGRPSLERHWTSYRHEAYNRAKDGDPLAETDGDEAKVDDLLDDSYLRSRYHEFVGFVGDFIHSIVSDPPAAIVSLASPESSRAAGKSSFVRLNDGTVLLQSVAEIRIERVCRILVPVRKKAYDSAEVDRKYRDLQATYLKIWKGWRNADDAWQMAYQVRSYSRWMSQFYALARVRSMADQFDVSTETEAPAPDMNNLEDDRQAANGDVEYIESYASICILRDGSVQAINGYGSAINMAGMDVDVSSVRHLRLESAGDTSVVVGRNLSIRVQGSTEFAVEKNLLLLAKEELSVLWNKTLRLIRPAGEDEAPAIDVRVEGDIEGRLQKVKMFGSDVAFDVENVDLKLGESSIVTRGKVLFRAGGPIAALINTLYSTYNEISLGDIFIRGGRVWLQKLTAIDLWANRSITGPQVGPIKLDDIPPGPSHSGHVRNYKDPAEMEEGDDEEGLAALVAAEEIEDALEEEELPLFEWGLVGYPVPRSLTQTFLDLGDIPTPEAESDWDLSSTGRVDGDSYQIRLNGANSQQYEFSTSGESLFTPEDSAANPEANWTTGTPKIKTLDPEPAP